MCKPPSPVLPFLPSPPLPLSISLSLLRRLLFLSLFFHLPTMPFCEVGTNGINIFYRTYGHGSTKVLLIIGLAGTHNSWAPQIRILAGTDHPNDDGDGGTDNGRCGGGGGVGGGGGDGDCTCSGIEVCAFDNRGVGQSSVPTKRTSYTTKIMAKDAIAIMDHLGWQKAHVFGHSMGGMIASKLAAIAPKRVQSLALLNVTGGGYECLPKIDRKFVSIAFRFLKAKTPEQRAAVDLDTHYSEEYLEEPVGSETRRVLLYREYVKGISSSGMQSKFGFEGQVNACWKHSIIQKEIESMRSGGFLVSVIHGRHDIIAQIYYARRLAERLYPIARMVDLHGGHLVSHERTEEVNQALLDLISASEKNVSPQDWTNISISEGWLTMMLANAKTDSAGKSIVTSTYSILERIYVMLLYICSLFVLLFECGRKAVKYIKPVKLRSSPS